LDGTEGRPDVLAMLEGPEPSCHERVADGGVNESAERGQAIHEAAGFRRPLVSQSPLALSCSFCPPSSIFSPIFCMPLSIF
jgi:hypothetical protein